MLGVLLLDFSCLLPKPTKATKKRFGKRGAFIWNQLPARLNLNWTADASQLLWMILYFYIYFRIFYHRFTLYSHSDRQNIFFKMYCFCVNQCP